MMPRKGSVDVAGTDAGGSVAALIDRWQSGHDVDALAMLLDVIREPLERVVAHTLRRRGVRDPGACDDAWALVIEHLARLGRTDSPRPVGAFDSRRASLSGAVDPGWCYLRCVARSRARDVARDRRRRDQRAETVARSVADASADATDERLAAATEQLRAAVARLDDQSRRVVMLLLDGKSQAVIAHVIGVCEGTVSRIRARAIAKLRDLLAE